MLEPTPQAQRNATRAHNIDVVTGSGYAKLGGSSLFVKPGMYLFSPGISKGKHEKYWFDIREANVKKIEKGADVGILLRIVPNMFAYLSWADISPWLTIPFSDIRANSGRVWGFYCDIKVEATKIGVVLKSDSSKEVVVSLLTRDEAVAAIASVPFG